MAKPKDKRPIPIALRRSITWRIPRDVLDDLQAVAKRRRVPVTQYVVEALQAFLADVARDDR